MTEIAVRCEGVCKEYALGTEISLQSTVRTVLGQGSPVPRFQALTEVTFEIGAGSLFGIVGHNGSGKSTLTQLISGISVPTRGRIDVWGRILPLLEVGAGFHEELTGEENVMLLGTILGLKRREINEAMSQIVEFSGITQHMTTPLKRYSSGMRARLSFATAVRFPADVYVFDEVLAVVDDDFRMRCVAEMRSLHAAGATVVLMSHDLGLIREMCEAGMWLDGGRVRMVGDMETVAGAYSRHNVALSQ